MGNRESAQTAPEPHHEHSTLPTIFNVNVNVYVNICNHPQIPTTAGQTATIPATHTTLSPWPGPVAGNRWPRTGKSQNQKVKVILESKPATKFNRPPDLASS